MWEVCKKIYANQWLLMHRPHDHTISHPVLSGTIGQERARTFGGAWDQQKWDHEEMDDYAVRVKMVGCSALMVNYLSDENQGWEKSYFGGAWVVSGDGEVIQSYPLGKRGLLFVELPGKNPDHSNK